MLGMSRRKSPSQIRLRKTCPELRCLLNGREQLTLPESVLSFSFDCGIPFAGIDELTNVSELSVTT
jgi:hypothetical protein